MGLSTMKRQHLGWSTRLSQDTAQPGTCSEQYNMDFERQRSGRMDTAHSTSLVRSIKPEQAEWCSSSKLLSMIMG